MALNTEQHSDCARCDSVVRERSFPHPYKAALAICSDVDCTPDFATYREIMRFLNTAEKTRIGTGLNMEVGNSMYFLAPSFRYAYWNLSEPEREHTRELIRSGYIDCLHSIGEDARIREHAAGAYEELSRHDCWLKVWVDHSKTPTNFGPDLMRGHGDEAGHSAYHADLAAAYGICFVWRGRVTSAVAQESEGSIRGILSREHVLGSVLSLGKHAMKSFIGSHGCARYRSIAENRLLWPITLRDGNRLYEFQRSNPHWAGPGCASGRDLAEVLSTKVLDSLIAAGGMSIIYTHFCAEMAPDTILHPRTVEGLRRLAEYYADGKILVTTTQRLLCYCRAREEVSAECRPMPDRSIEIHLHHGKAAISDIPLEDTDLSGLTFYTPDPARTRIYWKGQEVTSTTRNPPDETGKPSVSIIWLPLDFPPLV